jgi:hypothetical protein
MKALFNTHIKNQKTNTRTYVNHRDDKTLDKIYAIKKHNSLFTDEMFFVLYYNQSKHILTTMYTDLKQQ